MNNFNSYASPYSYQENPYGYYGNLPNQQPNYSSSPFNDVRMNKEENQSKSKNIERNTTSKPSIYTNEHIDKITGTKPVIFSAPEIDSNQTFEHEVEIEAENNEHEEEVEVETENNEHEEEVEIETENNEHEEEINDSSLMNDFLDELYENTIIENSSSNEEPIDDETELAEMMASDHDNEKNEDSATIMEEENHNNLLNDFSSLLEENVDSIHLEQESTESIINQNVSLEDTFYSMLSDNQNEQLFEHNHLLNVDHQEVPDLDPSDDRSHSNQDAAFSSEEKTYAEVEDKKLSEEKFSFMLEDDQSERSEELDKDNNRVESSTTVGENELTPITRKEVPDLDPSDDRSHSNQNASFSSEEKTYSKVEDKKSLEEKFSFMLEDDQSERSEESDKYNNRVESSTTVGENELKSITRKNNKDTKLDTERDFPLHDQSTNMLKEVDKEKVPKKRKTKLKKRKHIRTDNPSIDKSHKKIQNKKPNHVIEKNQQLTVKMPVLLGQLDLDIDIVQTLHLMMPIDHISKIEWSIHSLDCTVVAPSTTVFLKGELIADIEFIHNGEKNTIHSLKVPIPWSKTTTIHWLTLPDLSQNSHNEFTFHSQHHHDASFYYKSFHKFAAPIKSQLNQIEFVWHQELKLVEKEKKQKVDFQGTAHLTIDISQEQFIKLDNR